MQPSGSFQAGAYIAQVTIQKSDNPRGNMRLGLFFVQGVVVFFPSFGYCEEVQQAWAATGMLQQLSSKKKLFTEPRASSQVEATLKEYADSIEAQEGRHRKGAILLCIVGGKMSEGINFGDGLGR